MAQCSRVFVTLLHSLVVLDALFVFVYSLLTRNSRTKCFPRLVEKDGSTIAVHDTLDVICDAIVYSTGFTCLLHLCMVIFINCTWINPGVVALNSFFTLLTSLTATFGGTTFRVYSLIWCESLINWLPVAESSSSCSTAAKVFDDLHATTNTSSSIRRMDIQEFSIWSVVPITILVLLTYSIIAVEGPARSGSEPSIRFVLLNDERSEQTPLLERSATVTFEARREQLNNVTNIRQYSGCESVSDAHSVGQSAP